MMKAVFRNQYSRYLQVCKTVILLALLFVIHETIHAQYSIRLQLVNFPPINKGEKIFTAGNFNNWNPADSFYCFSGTGDTIFLVIGNLKPGNYEYKFTKGDWGNTEVTAGGYDKENRSIHLVSDTLLVCSVEGWKDGFAPIERLHTASAQVHVFDSAFFMPGLSDHRRIWVYLPNDYSKGKREYPVLYMQDGRNLFDEQTAAFSEWGIDEILDSLIDAGGPACIVVGIDNSVKRMQEYNPFYNSTYGVGLGKEYVDFIAEDLKPAIDKAYRTKPGYAYTFIAGSSMGGLIAYYAALTYPKVFGKAGVFSPAFQVAPGISDYTDSLAMKQNGHFFFFAGEKESSMMCKNMLAIADKLAANSSTLIYAVTDPEGMHNEDTWHKWFTEFYLWINGNGLSYEIRSRP